MITAPDLAAAGDDGITVEDGRLRARLLSYESVPYLKFTRYFTKHVALFDLASEPVELKYIDGDTLGIFHAPVPVLDVSGPNEDEFMETDQQLNYSGNPLAVDFLDIDTLISQGGGGVGISTRSRYDLSTHPMSTREYKAFHMKLMTNHRCIDDVLATRWILMAVDAAGPEHCLFHAVCPRKKLTATVQFLGRGLAAVDRFEAKLGSFHGLSLSPAYEVFAEYMPIRAFDSSSSQRASNVVSSMLKLEAKWDVSATNGIPKLFSPPPVNTPIKVTFTPGYLDQRVDIVQRGQNLDFLLTMADWLAAGHTDWPSTDVDEELLQSIDNLITNASSSTNFVGDLWLALQNCLSAETLVACLNRIFRALTVDHLVAKSDTSDTSLIARMLRSDDRFMLKSMILEPLTSISLLAGLGVDYFTAFLKAGFVESGFLPAAVSLEPFFLDSAEPIHLRAHRLLPIYLSFVTMKTIAKLSKFSANTLFELSSKALEKFVSSTSDLLYAEKFTCVITDAIHTAAFHDFHLTDWCVRTTVNVGAPVADVYLHLTENIDLPELAKRVSVDIPDGAEDQELKMEESASGNVKEEPVSMNDNDNVLEVSTAVPAFLGKQENKENSILENTIDVSAKFFGFLVFQRTV